MEWTRQMKVLIAGGQLGSQTTMGHSVTAIMDCLAGMGIKTVQAMDLEDAWQAFLSDMDIGCALVGWRLEGDGVTAMDFMRAIKARNPHLPIFLGTERLAVREMPVDLLRHIDGYIWPTEDTPGFIAGLIEEAIKGYVAKLTPPFFGELIKYAHEYKYAWHTPGHMGGLAFLKSPAGRQFFDYYGENVLRSDLSISVPELGSLLPHEGPVGEAEANAARAFGADKTYFVLNGTSTANKIVWWGRVTRGDVVIVDRNCHKSLEHAVVMSGAIPVWLVPSRNPFGIIGPIRASEFEPENIRMKLRECPLIKGDGPEKVKICTVTNSTYDGLTYNVPEVLKRIGPMTENMHFDEAWYAYARFHEVYDGRYGMHRHEIKGDMPPIFTTQSTHKLLAAFSQASMIHVADRDAADDLKFDHECFNEAFMMHTSTSPQYNLIASLDMAARMMQDGYGHVLMQDAIEEAIGFRSEMERVYKEIQSSKCPESERWFFKAWQPENISEKPVCNSNSSLGEFTSEVKGDIAKDPTFWQINDGDAWHGYEDIGNGYAMLDPIKVTILTPGVNADGSMTDWGIPAEIVSSFLQQHGVVPEKTETYSFLMLFSIAVTKGKSGTLMTELSRFKQMYDDNELIKAVLPEIYAKHPDHYAGVHIQDLAGEMHEFYKSHKMIETLKRMYDSLPEQAMTPGEAYQYVVRGKVRRLFLDEIDGKINASGLVPYPPGIPVIMPGELFDRARTPKLFEYFEMLEEFDAKFPGFEHEIHGITHVKDTETGRERYSLDVLA